MDILTSPFLYLWVLPLIVNFFLARSRGKNVWLMLGLTLIFSWIITISLACLGLVEDRYSPELEGNNCPQCHRQYRSEDVACFICSASSQLVEQPVRVQAGKVCLQCGRHNRAEDFTCYQCRGLLPKS